MEIFARLEIIADRQVLAELVEDDEGPKVRIRRDHELTVEVTRGPWPDDEDGWNAAEEFLRDVDLTQEAARIDLQIANLAHITQSS